MAAKPEKRIAEILADPRCKEMQRTFTVERDGIDKEKRTVELSFASETPVDRWFGREILDITEDACDLTRLNNGGAVLVNHEWDSQVGVVEKAWVDAATKKARARVKFSRTQAGEDIFTDIVDGIRSLVSVGYVVRKMVLQSVEGDVETHRVTGWLPFEVSIVSVPADTAVGVGRSQDKADPQAAHPAPAAPNVSTKRATMTPEEIAAKEAEARTQAQTNERTRAKDINAAAKQLIERHPGKAEEIRTFAAKCIETGDSVDAFGRGVAMDVLKTEERGAPAPKQDPNAATLGLSKRDIERYPLMEAIRCQLEHRPLPKQVREYSDELGKRLERAPAGFFMPDDVFNNRRQLRTLLAGNAVDGGYTVGSDLLASELVTFLRNQTRVMALGARVISGLRGDISIPRQLTGATAYWVSETGTITASSGTFGQIVGKPRRIGTSIPYSKQFVAQTSLDAESFVVNDSDESIAVELDRVAINGAGGSEPLGILNLASGDLGGTVTFSTAATWPKYLEFFQKLAEAKTLGLGNPAFLTTPASAVKAMSIPKFSNTATPIWDENNKIGPWNAQWSNQFPASGTLNQVIYGAFQEVIFLEWAGRDVVVDPYGTNATGGTVTVTIQRMIDMIIRRAKSFVRSTDSGAQ